MSNGALTACWRVPLPPPVKLVLIRIADCADDQTWSWAIGLERLEQDTGASRRTIIRAIADLERRGIVHVERVRNRANRYTILPDGLTLGCQPDTPEHTPECHIDLPAEALGCHSDTSAEALGCHSDTSVDTLGCHTDTPEPPPETPLGCHSDTWGCHSDTSWGATVTPLPSTLPLPSVSPAHARARDATDGTNGTNGKHLNTGALSDLLRRHAGMHLGLTPSVGEMNGISRLLQLNPTPEEITTACASVRASGTVPTSPAYFVPVLLELRKQNSRPGGGRLNGSESDIKNGWKSTGGTTASDRSIAHDRLSQKDYTTGASTPAELDAFTRGGAKE